MRVLIVFLALGACSQQPSANSAEAAPAADAGNAASVQQAALIGVPKDPAQLKRLEGMGYTAHDDHMHAPGVSTCPKMGDDPVM